MDHFNRKGFIIVLLMHFLVLKYVKGKPNEYVTNCIETIKAYYKVETNETPLPLHYAIYGMKHIRVCYETSNRIKIIPSSVGIPENTTESAQRQTSREIPEKVNDLNDLLGNLVENTADNKNHFSEEGSSSSSSHGGSKKGEANKIVVDYFKIPEDVSIYYMTLLPYLTQKSKFYKPTEYCWRFTKPETVENIELCINQIFESFNISEQLEPKEIISIIYHRYIIGELYSKSQEYAIEYIEHVAKQTKLKDLSENDRIPSPFGFCHKRYPQEIFRRKI